MDLGFKNKVVLITGASGGIGGATARIFSEEGAKVALCFHKNKKGAEELAARLPGERMLIECDVANEADMEKAFGDAVKKFGKVDIVVANAGVAMPKEAPIYEMESARFDEVISKNLKGAWLTAREFFKILKQTKPESASLIFASSTSGLFGEEGHSEYSASKAALVGLTKTLKNELVRIVPRGRVNAVAPGWVWTPMTEQFMSDKKAVSEALQTKALRRIGRPDEIASVIAALASDKLFGHVTGQVIAIDGGMEGRILWDESEVDVSQA
ncbi:MAG: SDR family NAD(P)-dependent oxidoreductase [bacterium]|nr:SDR family NAD(P)-dependent oxidoreductase [bacterium]